MFCECRNFGRVESRTISQETKKIRIKVAMTCNMNVQQDAKNNAELYTRWMKPTWKTFQEIIS